MASALGSQSPGPIIEVAVKVIEPVEDMLSEHPITTIALGFGLGFGLGDDSEPRSCVISLSVRYPMPLISVRSRQLKQTFVGPIGSIVFWRFIYGLTYSAASGGRSIAEPR